MTNPSLRYYMLMHGRKTENIYIRTTPALRKAVEERAQSKGLSLTGYIEYLILKEEESYEQDR